MPERMIRKRTKGWRMPADAVYVGRPTRWGNPFTVAQTATRTAAVAAFEAYAKDRAADDPAWLEPLNGKDLACWCPEDKPCHADVLLALANQG